MKLLSRFRGACCHQVLAGALLLALLPVVNAQTGYQVIAIVDQSGAMTDLGSQVVGGIRSSVKAINDAGGVNGRKVELRVLDSLGSAEGAQAMFRQAISAKPIAILNWSTSAGLASIIPLMNTVDIPVISAGQVEAMFKPTPVQWFFTPTFNGPPMMAAIAGKVEQVLGTLQGKRIAVVGARAAVIDGFIKDLEDFGQKKGAVFVAKERIPIPTPSFASQAANIGRENPDAVITMAIGNDSVTVAKALFDADYKGRVFGWGIAGTDQILERINNDRYYGMRLAPSTAPGSEAYAFAQKQGFESTATGDMYTQGVALGYILRAGLANCGATCVSKGLMDSIKKVPSIELPAGFLFGPLAFSEEIHAGATAAAFFVWDPASKKGVMSGQPVRIR